MKSRITQLLVFGLIAASTSLLTGCDKKGKMIEACDKAKSECSQACIAAAGRSLDTDDPCVQACSANREKCLEVAGAR